ncbi:hypothetical protein D9M68_891190 [compost metagenome]
MLRHVMRRFAGHGLAPQGLVQGCQNEISLGRKKIQRRKSDVINRRDFWKQPKLVFNVLGALTPDERVVAAIK